MSKQPSHGPQSAHGALLALKPTDADKRFSGRSASEPYTGDRNGFGCWHEVHRPLHRATHQKCNNGSDTGLVNAGSRLVTRETGQR
jgi:hypothetical protein